jgi:hypothetical protein
LDCKIDAALIARIEKKANGGSINKAALFLVRHWHELEIDPKPAIDGPKPAANSADMGEDNKTEDVDLLSSLNEIDKGWN